MRIAYLALATLLVAPSVCTAQILLPVPSRNVVDRLDHVVPIATVTRSGDGIALANAQKGDGFVVGAATFDLKDPAYPRLAFTLTNATQQPIPLSGVSLEDVRVTTVGDAHDLRFACKAVVRSVGQWTNTTLSPGTSVTVEMGVAPRCGAGQETVGFLVLVGSNTTQLPDDVDALRAERALLTKAFETLRSQP